MARDHNEMIAQALEMDPVLLPVATELLADLDALGIEPEVVVDVLREVGVLADHRVVDLGCGKGATCRAVAQMLGCEVIGVELFAPFVAQARSLAASAGLGERVTFQCASATDPPTPDLVGDVVIFAAMGDLLGPLDEAMASLRRWVRPGGFVVVDDSVLLEGAVGRVPGYETYTDMAGSRRRLEAHGDRVVVARVVDDGDEAGNDELAALRSRAAAVAVRHPELAGALADFIAAQAEEYEFLDEDTVGMVWVVQVRD